MIVDSKFLKNLADFAGGVDFNGREGTSNIKNCTFISNKALSKLNFGGGAAIKITGSSMTKIYSFNNKYVMSWGAQYGK